MINEQTGWRGRVRVTSTFADGSTQVDEFDNLITDAGRNWLASALSGSAGAGIRYVALGAGGSEPAAGDTALADERFRKQITKQMALGGGQMLTTAYIAAGEANDFAISEIGWYAGNSASATAGSGVLIARVLYSRQKTQIESLQIDRIDTIS